MWLSILKRRLAEATTFVEVSAVLCERARMTLDIHQSNSMLFNPAGRPSLNVDDVPFGTSDELGLYYVERFPIDWHMRRLLAHHAAVGDDGDFRRTDAWLRRNGYVGARLHIRLLPLIEPAGLLGSLRCGAVARLTNGQRRDLDVLAAYASARLVRLGVTAAAGPVDALTPAQQRVSRLAATGLSNNEIAERLEISSETVKKHLQAAFAKLGVRTRVQLASVFTCGAPREHVKAGVERRGEFRVITPRHSARDRAYYPNGE